MHVAVERLLAAVRHLHRPARAQGEHAGVDLHVDVLARPERAADPGERDPHLLLGQAEARRDLLPVDVEPLRGARRSTPPSSDGTASPPSGPSAA